MNECVRHFVRFSAFLAALVVSVDARGAAKPAPEQALRLKPIQSDVDLEVPTAIEVSKCIVQGKTGGGVTGWIVFNPAGQLLRRFLDTNRDNKVDLWCYYKSGIEVYRDIDGDFNGKADQCRWLGTAGMRWGLDTDEDGRIDRWRAISAEEVTSEVVAALRNRDVARFKRVLLTSAELESLGLGEVKKAEIAKKTAAAASRFAKLAQSQKVVTNNTKWLHFGASHPGVLPAGFDGSTKDVIVYDNVSVIVGTDGKHSQIVIGTMIQVAGGWRIVDLPGNLSESQTAGLAPGYFFQQSLRTQPELVAGEGGMSETVQKLIRDLEQVDKAIERASSPVQLGRLHANRADVLEQLAENAATAEDRDTWIRQYADSVGAAVQSGSYPDGVERLQKLTEKLGKSSADRNLTAFVKFRLLSADYSRSVAQPSSDYSTIQKIQDKWLADLRRFVEDYPKSEDTAEAMLRLAEGEELSGKTEEAIAWYRKIVDSFSSSSIAKKATGAKRRLESVGRSIELNAPSLADGRRVSLSAYRGRTVLIHYWASWCEPCKQDMVLLKAVLAKYAKQGFTMIGVNLDSDRQLALAYLRSNPLPWPQLYEPGGLDSRLATEMGVFTLPTMILIDRQGRVLNRNIHAGQLDEELGKRLR
jgi:thiol-disulfide isomerase/thioredoxin